MESVFLTGIQVKFWLILRDNEYLNYLKYWKEKFSFYVYIYCMYNVIHYIWWRIYFCYIWDGVLKDRIAFNISFLVIHGNSKKRLMLFISFKIISLLLVCIYSYHPSLSSTHSKEFQDVFSSLLISDKDKFNIFVYYSVQERNQLNIQPKQILPIIIFTIINIILVKDNIDRYRYRLILRKENNSSMMTIYKTL